MHVKNSKGEELVWTIDLKKVRFRPNSVIRIICRVRHFVP